MGNELIKQNRLASSATYNVPRKLPSASPSPLRKGTFISSSVKSIDFRLLEAVGNYLLAIALSIQTATGIRVIQVGEINYNSKQPWNV